MIGMNEDKIINQILNGATEQYALLVNRYHVGLIIHCERLTGNREDAEDIAQDAFIRAYDKLRDFDANRSKFSTWLYKIATNLSIDCMRRSKKFVDVDDIEAAAKLTKPMFIQDEERRAVRSAVERLDPPIYRQVIEEYYWNGLSYEQISQKLNKPTSTVGTYMRRAKMQLRGELKWTR